MVAWTQSSYTLPEGSHRGKFNVLHGSDPLWDLSYEFREINTAGPVCVIVPGHRSRGIDSPGNKAVADNVAAQVGMSVMAFDYTGCENTVKTVDPVTMDTNIADTRAVLNLFGQRPQILLARSYGFGVALEAANQNTMGLIGALPVSNLFEAVYKPYFDRKPAWSRWAYELAFEVKLRTVGLHCWEPKKKDYTNVDFVKVTRPFVRSLDSHRLPTIFERQSARFPVHLIANDEDKTASAERTRALEQDLLDAGFSAECAIVPGKSHELNEASHEAVVDAVRLYAPEI